MEDYDQVTSEIFHKVPTICSQCCDNEIKSFGWCQKCESLNFKKKYSEWTSENPYLDKIIQWSQENSFHNSIWSEGPLLNWDVENKKWKQNKMTVVLKRFKNSSIISKRFLTQIFRNIKCLTSDSLAEFYGITRHPEGDYMFVMKYYEDGNLYSYLDKNYGIITWGEIFSILLGISEGLGRIHKQGTYHSNLHGGNILIEDDIISTDAKVTDTGLHELISEMPKFYYDLMVSCWDPDPEARPSAENLIEILKNWIHSTSDDENSHSNSPEIIDQFNNAEEVRWTSIDKFKSIHDESYIDRNDVGWSFQKPSQEIHVKANYSVPGSRTPAFVSRPSTSIIIPRPPSDVDILDPRQNIRELGTGYFHRTTTGSCQRSCWLPNLPTFQITIPIREIFWDPPFPIAYVPVIPTNIV
ncbi:11320_t:CDS:2, partial [Diversispora eburnea]